MNEKQKRIAKVERILKKAKELRLNLDKVVEGKSLAQLAHNKKTVENLEKRFKRQKGLPKIREEIRKFEVEREKKKRRNIVTTATKAELKFNQDFTDFKNKKAIKEKTDKVVTEFMDKFFKQISFEAEAQKKIKKLKKRFGVRIDLAFDFMDYIADQSFKYEIDNEIYSRDFAREELTEDFNAILYERLDEFDRILNREYKI